MTDLYRYLHEFHEKQSVPKEVPPGTSDSSPARIRRVKNVDTETLCRAESVLGRRRFGRLSSTGTTDSLRPSFGFLDASRDYRVTRPAKRDFFPPECLSPKIIPTWKN